MKEEITLCENCWCMRHTSDGKCAKCGKVNNETKEQKTEVKKLKNLKRINELEDFFTDNQDMAEELLYRYSGTYRAYKDYKRVIKGGQHETKRSL